MRDRLYPNESREYREARDLLLEEEYAIVDKTRAVAAMRRNLPRGGELKEDYVCQWAKDGKVGERVRFSELFGDKGTLILYSFISSPWSSGTRAT
ncbi:DUF899 family protein [Allosphingosinicella sp.]|uniref:DUF899 family protein n=1 Tax=Allosphingosinicella sp. TaxID=2823234 RepID=UPI002FC1FEF1